jgi:hypothetical protein
MLLLKPKGRGNWAVLTMALEGIAVRPLLFPVGGTIVLAGITFRICKVIA